jgi:uncharacterized RDD family membrane protein YckC
LSEEQKEIYLDAYNAFSADSTANYLSAKLVNLSLLITSFAILLAYLVVEFVAPLLLGNGQTLGKKIFGVAIMREDGVKVSPVILFVRTILGKYAVETMVPIFIVMMLLLEIMGIVGVAVLGGLLVLQVALMMTSRARTPLHDRLARTVCVDLASQRIFESTEEMLAYRERIRLERAEDERNEG